MSKIIGICVALIVLRLSTLGHVLAQKKPVATLPQPPYCGAQTYDRLYASLDEFPWTALIKYRKSNGEIGFNCGGSLINSRYALTAAHCMKGLPSGWEVIGVRLGEYDLSTELDCDRMHGYCADPPVDVGIEKIIVHEDYANNKSHYNDIALIRFDRSVDMTEYISPVCLPIAEPQRSKNIVGLAAYNVGWGRTHTSPQSAEMLKIHSNITNPESCGSSYDSFGIVLKDTQICAKAFHSQGRCLSGGSPLTMRSNNDAANYLYGITSFGPTRCGSKDTPDVYTNVAKYIDWIENKIE